VNQAEFLTRLNRYFRARGWKDPSNQAIALAIAGRVVPGEIAPLLSRDFLTANTLTRRVAASAIAGALAPARSDVLLPPASGAVLFVDLVNSTARLAVEGDARWRQLVERFYSASRLAVERENGRVVKTTGDGMLAVVPTATAALRAAIGVRRAGRELGLKTRSAVHLTEMETVESDDVGGIGVNIAARALANAPDGAIVVTSTVREATSGQAHHFELLGTFDMKGVPGPWTLWTYQRGGRGRA
jgi:class 3 adenylate cyclase